MTRRKERSTDCGVSKRSASCVAALRAEEQRRRRGEEGTNGLADPKRTRMVLLSDWTLEISPKDVVEIRVDPSRHTLRRKALKSNSSTTYSVVVSYVPK